MEVCSKRRSRDLLNRSLIPMLRQIGQIRIELEVQPWMPGGNEIVIDVVGDVVWFDANRLRTYVAFHANRRAICQRSEIFKLVFVFELGPISSIRLLPMLQIMTPFPVAG